MAMYNDKVIDHFMNPHNVGEIEDASGVGTFGSPVCGDMMQMSIKVDDNGVITGMSADTLAPQGSATRAQCAAILMRCADLLA